MNFEEFKAQYEHKPVEENTNCVPKNPMVSVCVQTYQHVDYIRECLDGILMQKTNFPFEILLGEDDSSDGTREICLEYAEKHPNKIRLFLHHRENNIKINGNPTGRFNFLYNLHSAKGKYIALCEGDDYWVSTLKLQKQVDFLEENENVVICYHDRQVLTPKEELKKTTSYKDIHRLVNGSIIEPKYFMQTFMPTLTLMFRNDLKKFKSYNMKGIFGGDVFLRAYFSTLGKGGYLPFYGAVYREHSGGIYTSNDQLKKINLSLQTRKAILREIKDINKKDVYLSMLKINYSKLKLAIDKKSMPLIMDTLFDSFFTSVRFLFL